MNIDAEGTLAAFGYVSDELANMSHGALVTVMTTLLERRLEILLQGQMIALNKKDTEHLFEGYGPLSSFSAKIAISHAFGLITAEQRKTLDDVRKVRNVFAHSDSILHFSLADFQDHPKLRGNPLKGSIREFTAAVRRIADELKPAIQNALLAKAIGERSATALAPKIGAEA